MAENRFDDLFADADAAFNGRYKTELNQLMGLSKEEINAITPDTTDLKIYAVLIKVVEKASKDNLSQAQLIQNIKSMGDVAVQIAKKVAGFAALL
jgi:tRNA U54 and U55 pseudouridine synthase Pus10